MRLDPSGLLRQGTDHALIESAGGTIVDLLFMTQQGRRILPELREIADPNDRRFFDCLNTREKAMLGQLLRKLTTSNEIADVPVE